MIKVTDFIQKDFMKLPKNYESGNFREYLFNLLDLYQNEIKNVEIDGFIFDPKTEFSIINDLILGIKISVQQYLNGHPSKAYESLKKSLEKNLIFSYLSRPDLSPNTNLYRLRVYEENYALKQQELFHIPFNMRGKVATQRYSIPGFPCLYASNSIYVAWEELGRKSIEEVHAIRFKTTNPIQYIDLTTDVYTGRDNYLTSKTEAELWKHISAWPLIAACSIKVFDKKASFKPEYIIPQLLLQIVRNEKVNVNGIRFSSTHINQNIYDYEGEFYNFVFPVKSECDKGFCSELINFFEATDVVPWQLAQNYSASKAGTLFSPPLLYSKINKIELIKGAPQGYMFTTFANLENTLNHLHTRSISVI
jgi:hypothetical protein